MAILIGSWYRNSKDEKAKKLIWGMYDTLLDEKDELFVSITKLPWLTPVVASVYFFRGILLQAKSENLLLSNVEFIKTYHYGGMQSIDIALLLRDRTAFVVEQKNLFPFTLFDAANEDFNTKNLIRGLYFDLAKLNKLSFDDSSMDSEYLGCFRSVFPGITFNKSTIVKNRYGMVSIESNQSVQYAIDFSSYQLYTQGRLLSSPSDALMMIGKLCSTNGQHSFYCKLLKAGLSFSPSVVTLKSEDSLEIAQKFSNPAQHFPIFIRNELKSITLKLTISLSNNRNGVREGSVTILFSNFDKQLNGNFQYYPGMESFLDLGCEEFWSLKIQKQLLSSIQPPFNRT